LHGLPERRRQPNGVLGETPPVSRDQPGMIVDEREEIRFPAADPPAVQRIPGPQLVRIGRLEPAIAVLSVVTTTLLQLRDAARAPDADRRLATEVIGADYVDVLVNHYGNRLGPRPTIRQFYMHVARLGGHQNRKADGR